MPDAIPLLMSPRQAARFCGIGHNKLREMVATHKLDAVMVGTHIKIKSRSLLELIEENLPSYEKGRRPARKAPRKHR